MNGKQQGDLGMYLVFRNFILGVSPAIIATMPNFAAWFESFRALVNDLFLLEAKQEKDRKGVAEAKAIIREQLIGLMVMLSTKLMALATALEDAELYGRIGYSQWDLERLSALQFIAACTNILEAAIANVGGLADYDITAGDITDINAKFADFVEVNPTTKTARNEKKGATEGIVEKITAAKKLLKKLDGLAKSVKTSQKEFYGDYFRARKVDAAAEKTVVVRGKVTDASGAALPLVRMSCAALGINRKVSKKGSFLVRNAVDGVYEFIFVRPGFATVLQSVNICNGIRTEVLVVMNLHVAAVVEA